jgi:hypothetical protein
MNELTGRTPYLMGMNPMSDWNDMEKGFINYGGDHRHGAGDYGEYDKRKNIEGMLYGVDAIEQYLGEAGAYGDKHGQAAAAIRKQLVIASVESVHIRGKFIEMWESGWCSGNYMTALLNSVVNEFNLIYCFGLLKAKTHGLQAGVDAISIFHDVVYARYLGDDNRFAVKAGFEWFNMVSLSEALLTIGEVYTGADKELDFTPFVGRLDASLLKRTPLYHADLDIWVGVLEFSVIIDMLNYTVRGKEIEVIKQRADSALFELAIRTEAEWNYWLPRILKWVGPFYRPEYITWHAARRHSIDAGMFTIDYMARVVEDVVVDDLASELSLNNEDQASERTRPEFNLASRDESTVGTVVLLPVGAKTDTWQRPEEYPDTINQSNDMSATPNTEIPSTDVGANVATEISISSHNVTTKFADDTLGYESKVPLRTGMPSEVAAAVSTSANTTIAAFLERPSVIWSGLMQSTDSGVMWKADAIEAFNDLKLKRIFGIYTLKFDVRITLQVNASRYTAGRYILYWVPTGGVNANVTDSADVTAMLLWRNARVANLTTITQLPHVEIDLAKQTHVTLVIPYSNIFPFFEYAPIHREVLDGFIGGMGEVGLIPYYPLIPGSGVSSASYTIWASIENLSIGSNTCNQMGDISVDEAKAMGVGPVSGMFSRVSKAANEIGVLPLIGDYAKSVSWIAGVMSKSASWMGWSKPLNASAPQRISRNVAPFSSNYDMPSTAKPLGVASTNSVVPHNGVSGTNIDEMSYDYIKSQYAYFQTITWVGSDAPQTNLMSRNVTPDYFTTWSKGRTYLPMGFLAAQHRYFRGGVKFRFKLVKTEFHRGRLMVAFSPGPLTGAFTYAASEMVYREVVDIATTSEFEVCCPYLLTTPWQLRGEPIGTLSLFVENVLIAPSSVGATIPILVEMCGADDLEFAVPIDFPYEPYLPSTSQMADPYVTTPCFTLGPSSPVPTLAGYGIGESLFSVRQIMKRLCFTRGTFDTGNKYYMSYTPYAFYPVTQAAGTSGALQRMSQPSSDYINLWTGCYAFSTGSIRVVGKPSATSAPVTFGCRAEINYGAIITDVLLQSAVNDGKPWRDTTVSVASIEGLYDWQAPVWNSGLARCTINQMVGTAQSLSIEEPRGNPTLVVFGDDQSTTIVNIRLGRYAGDDFSLMRWCGVVPVVSVTAT